MHCASQNPFLLLQVDELQNTVEDEQKGSVDELRNVTDESKASFEDANGGGSESMAVD